MNNQPEPVEDEEDHLTSKEDATGDVGGALNESEENNTADSEGVHNEDENVEDHDKATIEEKDIQGDSKDGMYL